MRRVLLCHILYELVHSTSHALRLARKEVMNPQKLGGMPYSKEELIAEMGSFISFMSWPNRL
ncbi:MAG: hypothetical protein IPO78_10205 [Saprospiraceae bacterium]|nr:hypothetical protein [Saprospiraceae bacterium]